ncbi:FecCD family ABC transporter permease [Balneatrix alpica]|uniref:FecCD family ABC transporter permease n=1 Tax=Balneatrix alpica TaxID=75684 RepID=UPI0027383655|nr:iron ABC transporter permease [Balneatrix alpica]
MMDSSLVEHTAVSQGSTLASHYRQFVLKRVLLLLTLAVAGVLALLADMVLGPSSLGLSEIWQVLMQPEQTEPWMQAVVMEVRIPYALMAVVVGACLGLAGAEMQTALNNPLASPFTLGIGAAATLGAAIVILFDFSWTGLSFTYLLPLGAFVCASFASLLVLALSCYRGASVNTVVLFGISLFFALNALVSLLMFVADTNSLQQIVFWTMGSLSRANLEKVTLVAVVFALCLPLAMRHAWAMTALRSGEDQAKAIGIRVERMRLVVLLRVSLLTAAALAFVGEIGFIGLVGPHMARMLLGEDHRFFLPGSALAGALLLSLASIASKALIPGIILPVGIVTALVGIPLFMSLILSHRREM